MKLLYQGSQVKSLGNRSIGGLALKFTDETNPDLYKEYFKYDCDFGVSLRNVIPIYFNHSFDDTIKKARIGEANLTKTKEGLTVSGFIYDVKNLPNDLDSWSKKIIKERAEYIEVILSLIESGQMGYSTGSVSHLVQKSEPVKGSTEITKWDIAELSITHVPAEPRTYAVKSTIENKFDWSNYIKIGATISQATATELNLALEKLALIKITIENLLKEYKNINLNDNTKMELTALQELITTGFTAIMEALTALDAKVTTLVEAEAVEQEVAEVEPTEAVMSADEIIKRINSIIIK